jgi:hypothetical protein
MFGSRNGVRELAERVRQLENSLALVQQEWKGWRDSLNKAAARLERAEQRSRQREEPEAPAPDPAADLNARILKARREGSAAPLAG